MSSASKIGKNYPMGAGAISLIAKAGLGYQRIVKIVDTNEQTILLLQEIYNDANILIERHQKFPVDTGHERLVNEE